MAEDTVRIKLKRKRKTKKKKSVVDSAARNAAVLTDGCNPELVVGAEFDGILEIPIIKKPKKIIIPDNLVPFSKMEKVNKKKFAVCEYENDSEFRDCFQKHGVYVVPCVRWGDERTYTTKFLPEKIAFLGVEKHSIVSIGTYGQLKNTVNRYYFEKGLDSMMETLEPEIVLVYSKIPEEIKEKYPLTNFVEYEDWTSMMRKEK